MVDTRLSAGINTLLQRPSSQEDDANAVEPRWPHSFLSVSRVWPVRSTPTFPVSILSGAHQVRARSVTSHIEEAVMGNTRALAATIVALTVIVFGRPSPALADDGELVIEWNRVLFSVVPPGPPVAIRPASMMHIAMFDAVNAIADVYTPYRFEVRASRGASEEAAAAQAAHDVLTALFPSQQATFDAVSAGQFAGIPPGRAKQGIAIGRAVAEAVLLWRQNDGWPATIVPDPTYVLPPTPGNWQPTPPANSFATFTFFPKAMPFGIQTSTQFLPPPPPALTSQRYATDFNEVKSLGLATSDMRTPEQTEIAQRIAAVGFSTSPVEVFFRVAEDVARTQGLPLVDTARLFAFVSVAHHDGLQTSFTSKFVYGLWRPVTAIQRADEDGNPATDPDPDWLPLLITPPYPSYAGNASCAAAAAARALQLVFATDEVPFSVTWVGIAPTPTSPATTTGWTWRRNLREAVSTAVSTISSTRTPVRQRARKIPIRSCALHDGALM